ncbi:MAG: class I SAM-dependent methyltransferase [Candidatus Omnitrophica bacterium]|nr:class I SAM-dependent methyltransferase [Candidatus Omnitrophota bacterium]
MNKVLQDILLCPDCSQAGIDVLGKCGKCGHVIAFCDGICNGMPSVNKFPLPKVYNDPHYLKYNDLSGKKDEFFYRNANSIINWVQASGYRSIKTLLGKPEGLVLESGCGTGIFGSMNSDIRRDSYVMTDIDEESLKRIALKDTFAGIVKATAYCLPFKDQTFACVLSHAQLEHLCYLDHALEEISRVLRPGGRFIASVPAEGGWAWMKGRELTSARYFGDLLNIDYIRANRIDHFQTIQQIDRAVRRHFEIEKRIFFPLGIPNFHLNLTCTYLLRHKA